MRHQMISHLEYEQPHTHTYGFVISLMFISAIKCIKHFKLILHISIAKMVPLNFEHNIRINLCKVGES